MKRTFLLTTCALALSAASASAQPSQGKVGAENGPVSNSVRTNDTTAGTTRIEPGTVGESRGSTTVITPAPSAGVMPVHPGDTSSEGNVGPGTSNNTLPAPGGR